MPVSTGRHYRNLSVFIVMLAIMAAFCADLEIISTQPGKELSRMLEGLLSPDFFSNPFLVQAFLQTIGFALVGVALAVILGFLGALVYHLAPVRWVITTFRAVHELFWGLLFMQVFGLTAITGLLAIAVPYSAIFAKMFHEQLLLVSDQPERIAHGGDRISRFMYTRLPLALPAMASYTRYRFECGLRSATILGFIGLPTLGFYLESALKQGLYSDAAALLLLFYGLTASIPLWLKPRLIPIYLIMALWLLPIQTPFSSSGLLWTFLSVDIIPPPLREGLSITALHTSVDWFGLLLSEQGLPGLWNTIVLTLMALACSGLLCLLWYPMTSHRAVSRWLQPVTRGFLIVGRATPEILLVFIVMLITGPSMAPALIALAIHNGAILAFLLGRQLDTLPRSPLHKSPANAWAYEWTPGLYPSFLSLLLYRAETIVRESAIIGIIGIPTLGFYIDSAFEDLAFSKAVFLIGLTALLTILVDTLSRSMLRKTTPQPVPDQ